MGKFDNLILYRGTVTGANPLNRSCEQRGTIKILADNLMSLGIGVNEITGQLRPPGSGLTLRIDRIWRWKLMIIHHTAEETKIERYFASRLKDGFAEINGSGIEAGGGT